MKKISVNKIAEYLRADSVRRRRIIEDQKSPMEFIVTRYSEARKAIVNYLSNNFDKSILENEIEQLNQKTTGTNFQENDIASSILALKSMIAFEIPDNWKELNFSLCTQSMELNFNDVKINVNPDILIQGKLKGKEIKGGIKLYIGKTNPLKLEDMKVVSTLVHQVLENKLSEPPNLVWCISIDVFSKSLCSAPKSYKNIRKNIEFACEELSIVWEKT